METNTSSPREAGSETAKAPPDLVFERIRLRDVPEVIALALANTDPRIASYAVEPAHTARRARLKGWLSELPWIGGRFAQPERSFWIVAGGRREGFVLLDRRDEALHLELVVLTRALQGTGAAGVVLRFVEETAREAGCRSVDLFVDRHNYRAFYLYRRAGFRTMPERRFVFEVPRAAAPSAVALSVLPWHGLAAVFGVVTAPRPAAGVAAFTSLQEGLVASLCLQAPAEPRAVEAAVREVLRGTLARVVRVTLPFEGNVRGGRLVAVLHRMEKVLG